MAYDKYVHVIINSDVPVCLNVPTHDPCKKYNIRAQNIEEPGLEFSVDNNTVSSLSLSLSCTSLK